MLLPLPERPLSKYGISIQGLVDRLRLQHKIYFANSRRAGNDAFKLNAFRVADRGFLKVRNEYAFKRSGFERLHIAVRSKHYKAYAAQEIG